MLLTVLGHRFDGCGGACKRLGEEGAHLPSTHDSLDRLLLVPIADDHAHAAVHGPRSCHDLRVHATSADLQKGWWVVEMPTNVLELNFLSIVGDFYGHGYMGI